MRILIQITTGAKVEVDRKVISSIGRGEVLFVSFTNTDTKETVDKMIEKLLKLRIFPDDSGKTNLSIDKINGEILAISQFTLYADLKGGNRPSFTSALKGEEAIKLYDYFSKEMEKRVSCIRFGIFGADMKVSLLNDGPFTIMLDSKELGL